MPIYEYLCEKCGNEFEREQRITDDPVKSCPKCRGRKVKRLISQTSFALKGGGWYSDLYSSAKKGSKGGDKGESASPDAGSASGDAKDAKDSKKASPSKESKAKSSSRNAA